MATCKNRTIFFAAAGAFLFSCSSFDGPSSPNRDAINIEPQPNKRIGVGHIGMNYFRLNKISRCYSAPDHMACNHGNHCSGQNEGLAFYVLNQTYGEIATHSMWELFRENHGVGDHMTSYSQIAHCTWGMPCYDSDEYLGQFFSHPHIAINGNMLVDPLQPIRRYSRHWGPWWDPNRYWDHLDAFPDETPSGYTYEGTIGYGFRRYGFDREHGAQGPGISDNISGNGVTVGFIRHWGGITSSIQLVGTEYLSRWDPGRELQMATNIQGEQYNPTEGGDVNFNGAPLRWFERLSNTRFATRTIPLMWKYPPNSPNPADPDHPLLYGGVMTKDIEIINDISGAKVVRYSAAFTPYETNEWEWIHIALYMNYGFMNRGASPFGWHKFYHRSGSNYVQTASRNVNGSTPWGIVRTESSGTGVLVIAQENRSGSNGRAIGLLCSNPSHGVDLVDAEFIEGGSGWDELSYNTHALYIGFKNVQLNSGSMFWTQLYVLLGTEQQIRSAAAAIP